MWLKGDFHAHSTLSDGVLTPEEFIAEAEREELDFFAITDHNVWAYPAFAGSKHVLPIAGVEVTMPYGHFNVFSTDASEPTWVSQLPAPGPVDRESQAGSARALLDEVAAAGLRASINHPLLFPWEWTDSAAPLEAFRCLEVWNDPTWPENRLANPAALDMWTRWLVAGIRVTALGGSDFHNPEKLPRYDGMVLDGHRIGMPRSWVDADARTPESILTAVDAGRVFVTLGPQVDFTVVGASGEWGMGSRTGVVEERLVVHARATGTEHGDLEVRVIVDGTTVAAARGRNPSVEHPVDPDPARPSWVRIDVADADGVVAFTNPVYIGPVPDRAPGPDYGSFTDISTAFELQQEWTRKHTEEDTPWRDA